MCLEGTEIVPHHPGLSKWQAQAMNLCGTCGLTGVPTIKQIVCAARHKGKNKAEVVEVLSTLSNELLHELLVIGAAPDPVRISLRPVAEIDK